MIIIISIFSFILLSSNIKYYIHIMLLISSILGINKYYNAYIKK
jgi:hypothetical protein